MNDTFVNPYTFVPFPKAGPHRCEPHGHLGQGELLSGKLVLALHARTPLLIREMNDTKRAEPDLPRRPDGTPIIPGSSLKGALRSLHETLTGSCLRVFDEDFVPGYRDPASTEKTGKRHMAIVERHDSEDTPPVLRVCDKGSTEARLRQEELARLHREEEPLTSGDRLKVDFDDESGRPVRAHHHSEGEWVVLLSDASARKQHQPYYAHIRSFTGESPKQQLQQEVWDDFRSAVENADELRTAQQGKRDEQDPFTEVTFTHVPKGRKAEQGTRYELGRRHLASKRLRPGQPVWVTTKSNGEIDSLRLGMLGRHAGKYPAGDRVRPELLPCRDHEELCPSCRLFGSADTAGKDSEKAQQRSYRGHVRVGDAVALDEVTPWSVTLPPMGIPRPGAGQFYLVNDAKVRGNAAVDPPLREWGSAADQGDQPRDLRGRKHYWHTPTENGGKPSRAEARKHQLNSDMTSEAKLFPTGTRFTVTIAFTDVDEVQLGGLLACLSPSSVLGGELWQHVGGGRPLGLGSCTFELDEHASEIRRSGARYGAAQEPVDPSPERFRAEFQSWMRQQAPAAHELWPQLRKALSPNTVNPNSVWYPPGAYWNQQDSENFDRGYEFWKRTSGTELKPNTDGPRIGYPLLALPDIDEQSQELPIIPNAQGGDEEKSEKLPNQVWPPSNRRSGTRDNANWKNHPKGKRR
ncbi:CRISPR-associated protein [Actinopolyspora alba]|uniref:CRISPR-associated protein n=1 Tax=Actinopolyspora alba TaxID=673379 RepID=A0A1I1Z6J5_9ACTN|nr:TIGR03986 family CRISPR-associated RAMP protein [Actinopolyspora alba]SFE27355.1 CRISPR-associated protein [Actinopolyspora alba]